MSTTSGDSVAVVSKGRFFQETKHLRKDSSLYTTSRSSQEQRTDTRILTCYVRGKSTYNLTSWDTFRTIFISQLRLTICYSAWCYRAHLQVPVLITKSQEKTADCIAKVQVTFYIHRSKYLAYITTPITEYPNYILNSIINFLLAHLLPSSFPLCTKFCFFPPFCSCKVHRRSLYQSANVFSCSCI